MSVKAISYENLSTFADELKKKYAKASDIPVKVSDLTNDAGFQTEAQVTAAINTKVSSAYKAGGSVAFAELPELIEANLGVVVNITSPFTTTDDFVEGAGEKHPGGTNVVVAKVGDNYKYDVLAGFVDLSGYVKASDLEYATAEEIQALFANENSGE